MSIKTVGALLAGSILVHAAVVACSDPSLERAARADNDAAAEVSPATCNATFQVAAGGDSGATTSVPYSEHAYPGKSKGEIAAHVSHWTVIDDSLSPPEYTGGLRLQTNLIVRDGFAGAACASGKTSYFVWRP